MALLFIVISALLSFLKDICSFQSFSVQESVNSVCVRHTGRLNVLLVNKDI